MVSCPFSYRQIRKPLFILLLCGYAAGIGTILFIQFPSNVVYEPASFIDRTGSSIDAEVIRSSQSQYGTAQPLVVLVHGICMSKEFMYSLGVEFALRGFLVISISMPGHGLSDGPFQYANRSPYSAMSAVDYMQGNYAALLDPTKIAIIGHSFGAYTAVKAGFLDTRFQAAVAIAAPFSLENNSFLNNNPNLFNAGLKLPEEGLSTYLNSSNPKNLLTIVGKDDFLALPAESENIIGAALTIPSDLVENGTLYGSFTSGTARELAEFPSMDHFTECFDARSQFKAIQWVEQSLQLDTSGLPNSVRGLGLVSFASTLLSALIGLLLLPFLFSYFAELIHRQPRDELFKERKVEQSKIAWIDIGKWTLLFFGGAGVLPWVLLGLSNGFTIFPAFSFLDRSLLPFLVVGSLIMMALLIIFKRKTNFGQQWIQGNNIWSRPLWKNLLVGVVPTILALLLASFPISLSIFNLFPVGPRIVPFANATAFSIIAMAGVTLVFKYIIGDHILRRSGFWTGRILASLFTGFTLAATASLCYISTFGDLLLHLSLPTSFFAYWVVLGVLLTIVDFFTAQWLYCLEGDALSVIVSQGILFGFVFSMIFPILA